MVESFNTREQRELEMAVRVFKKDGTEYAVVPEAELERHGWGTDPLEAVERYRAWRTEVALAGGQTSWDNTDIRVKTDEESGYPAKAFVLRGEIVVRSTRHQAALRMIAQALMDVANGSDLPEAVQGKFQFLEEE